MAKISNLDFYAILGVHPNAEDIVIRAAFKALAQRYHPDRFAGSKDEAHRRMADLTNAYETLADPARRRKYDRRRGLSARQAKFYFKNPARDRQPFGALAARAAARKARHYRIAVYVLMVAVVILSGFNVHQHSAQIKELFAWNRTSSGVIGTTATGAVVTSPVPATADAVSSSATPAATTANVRILPIGQGISRPIGAPAVEPPSPAPQPLDPPPAATPPALENGANPAAPASVMKTPAPPPPANVSTTPARPAPVEPQKAAVPASAAPDVPHKEVKRATPKPVIAKAVEPDRPAAQDRPPARPSTADSERCAPELVALGLCGRSSATKE